MPKNIFQSADAQYASKLHRHHKREDFDLQMGLQPLTTCGGLLDHNSQMTALVPVNQG